MSHPFGSQFEIPIDLETEHTEVIVNSRRFEASWSYEAVQDLQAMHNIDAEQILHQNIVAEITAEIDAEIIGDINVAIQTSNNSRELPYLSSEALDDFYAWAGVGERTALISTPHHISCPQKTHNWKEEGF